MEKTSTQLTTIIRSLIWYMIFNDLESEQWTSERPTKYKNIIVSYQRRTNLIWWLELSRKTLHKVT